ncbi:MAG: hypothetical protein MRY74_01495 [Neomegalonema sp.]|nr:hypothetical protein [Neomegalonema sp.]
MEPEVSISWSELGQEFINTFTENAKQYGLFLVAGLALLIFAAVMYSDASDAQKSLGKLERYLASLPAYSEAKTGQVALLAGRVDPDAPVFDNVKLVSTELYSSIYDAESRTYRYSYESEITKRFPIIAADGAFIDIINDDFSLWFDNDPRFPGMDRRFFPERLQDFSERTRLFRRRFLGLAPGRPVLAVGVKTPAGVKAQVVLSGPLPRIQKALREKSAGGASSSVFTGAKLVHYLGLIGVFGTLLIWAHTVRSGVYYRKRAEARVAMERG